MKRRHSLPLLLGWPWALRAQERRAPPASVAVVCYMALATRQSDASSVAAFREGMLELGHVEGRSYLLVEAYANGDMVRAEALLREQLARQPVSVFLTPGAAAVRLILRNTQSVPIVSAGLHPRGGQTDLFASLARPGGMVTGVSNFGEELAAKRVQLLREVLPRLATVGVLHNTTDPVFRQWGEETEAEIRAQGLSAVRLGLSSPAPEAMQRTLRDARGRGVEAVVIVRDFLTSSLHVAIARSSRDIGLASIAEERRYPEAGALMSYGSSDRDLFRSTASYVDRILKGARPADLPVQQPTRFELVVNAGTARLLGIPLPKSMLLRADEVIG
jgi:putative tryptophan/tyrosine transport system substrate-binding protein